MNKKCEVFQEDHSDCAAACLSSIIKYYKGYMSLEDIRVLIKTTKKGTSAYDLLEGAREIGFDSIGKKCSFLELINMESPLPLIAHVKKDNYYHFVVIYEINVNKERITVMDPSIGFKSISFEEFQKVFLEVVLLFIKVKELPKNNKNKELLKVFKTTMLDNKLKLFVSFILSVLLFILSIIQIYLYKTIFSSNLFLNSIKYTVISILIVLITKNIVLLLKNLKLIKLKYITDKEINKEVMKKLFLLSYDYLKNKTTGEIISRINDIDLLKDVFIDLIINAFVNIILIIIFLFLILKESIYLGIIAIIYVVFYLIVTFMYKHKYEIKTREVQECKGKYANDLVESIDNLETISNLNIKEKISLKIKNSYNNYVLKIKKYNKLTTTEHFFKNILSDFGIVLIIILSFYLVNKGTLLISNAIIIYMLFSYITNNLFSLLERIPDITYAVNNIERTSVLLSNSIETKGDNHKKGDIEIKGLSYNNGNNTIITNLNLCIPLKSKLCLSGKSGIGKSTILKILLKYKNNYKGKITIDNVNLKDLSIDFIRNNFVYIGQNEKLFIGSLKYNITLDRNVSSKEVDKVIKICKVDEIIDEKSLRDNTYIESDGFNLSGGERQRIILARGLLKKCEYIIIDEALSEVDIDLEKAIIKNILTEFKDKTIIYVTHKKEVRELFEKNYDLERSKYE